MYRYTILEQWLKEKLGIILEDQFRVGSVIKNGEIVAMLLNKYGVVPKARLKVRQSNSNLIKQNFENWTMIKKWLSSIDFDMTDLELIEICAGNNSTALKFLYRLYLKLIDLNVTTKINSKLLSKFQVTSLSALNSSKEQNQQSNIKTLIGYKARSICERYFQEQCICNATKSARKYKCEAIDNVLKDIQQFEEMHENKTSSYNVPLRAVPLNVKMSSAKSVTKSITSPAIASMECDECKESKSGEYEDEYSLMICTQDLVHQSKYEKKACEALQLIKCQQYTLLENYRLSRNIAESEVIIHYETEIDERKSENEEEERKNILNRKIHYLCLNITYDFINIAHRIFTLNINKVPKTLWQQWKQAFIKDNFDDLIENIIEMFQCFNENTEEKDTFSETSIMKLNYLECLAKADVCDYLKFERDWILDDEMRVPPQEELGFIVTKLLRHIATVPAPPLKPPLPHFGGSFFLHGIPEKYYNLFRSILKENGVLFITPEDLINFCVAAYKNETPFTEMVEEMLTEEDQSCKFKSPSESMLEGGEEGEEVAFFANKRTQTPAVLPEEVLAEISPAAVVGGKITESLITGKEIGADIIVEALLCFLMKAEVYEGWVLVDFPNQLNDVSEIESHLQGCFVPLQSDNNAETDIIYKSKLLPFIVNSDNPFNPYISQCIFVKTNNKIKSELNMVHEFYKRYDRYKRFRCHAISGLHKDVVISVLKFILQNITSDTMEERTESDDLIDLSTYGILEESRSMSSLFAEEESLFSNEMEAEYEEEEEEEFVETSIIDSELFIKYFHFLDFNVPSEFMLTMGQLWQNLEQQYLDMLMSVFSLKRKENSTVLPFTQLVENLFKDTISLQDNKQQLVDTFQKEFNLLSNEKRCCEDIKNLLHDKVFNLQLRLWEISDENQEVHREHVAQKVASLDWFMDHLNVTCKLYLTIVNGEIARFSETMQILADYYLIYLRKVPLSEKIVNIEGKNINFGSDNSMNSKTSKLWQFITFESADGFYTDSQYLYEHIHATFEYYEHEVETCNIINNDYSKMKSEARQEMESAVASEKERILLRLKLIRRNFESEIELFETWCSNFLNNQFNTMVARYEREMAAINNLCSVMNVAIEEETSLYRRLILQEDTFYIACDLFLQPPQSLDRVLSRSYSYKSNALTPKHIDNLRKVLQCVTSDDVILNSVFLFILEDLLIEETHKDCLPKSWKMIKKDDLKNMLNEIFSNTLHCNWKDFLINAFEVSYPSLSQLIKMAKEFQTFDPEHSHLIDLKDFVCTKFWFDYEPNPSPELLKELFKFKQFLFELFQIDAKRTNYNLMLLHLCKDYDPLKGFCKALSLVSFNRTEVSTRTEENNNSATFSTCENSEENFSLVSRPDSCIFDFQRDESLISYEDFEKVLSSSFPSDQQRSCENFPEDIQKCLENIQSQWTSLYSMCKVLETIYSEPCLHSFLLSSHKFKACAISEIIDRYIYADKLDCSSIRNRIGDCADNLNEE